MALQKRGELNTLSDSIKANCEIFLSSDVLFVQDLTPELGAAIKTIWAEESIKKTYLMNSSLQVNDSATFYFDAIDRIAKEDYLPSQQDVLQSRARTSGISEIQFHVGEVRFKMVDVGGQRSERKKWIHCFQDVTAVIFCVAMNEYDLTLAEDDSVNRMQESMMLFEEICNCQWFNDTAIILFLNKSDLFNEKIARIDLKVCFPEYTGGCDTKAGTSFMKEKFTGLNRNKNKSIYVHITCATNTDNITYVFSAVRDIILRIAITRVTL